MEAAVTAKALTWTGPFMGNGAYPTINRQLTAALERRGWKVLRNLHNQETQLTPLLVSCIYPPTTPNIRHDHSICVTNWEFVGPRGTPQSFLKTFQQFDVVWAKSAQARDAFIESGATNTRLGRLGIDPEEFTPEGKRFRLRNLFNIPPDAYLMLWVGGTDPRHGFDLAVEVLKRCPENIYLVAKQSVDYPAYPAEHPRLRILRADLKSLAPLYREADLLLHPARAVGFSMPVCEALACGLRVLSTRLPAIQEFNQAALEFFGDLQESPVLMVETQLTKMGVHHLHKDCVPFWWEPNLDHFVTSIVYLSQNQDQLSRLSKSWSRKWAQAWSWDRVAEALEDTIRAEWSMES